MKALTCVSIQIGEECFMVSEIKSAEEFLAILSDADLSDNAYLSYDYYRVYIKYNPQEDFRCFCVILDGKCRGLLPLYRTGLCYQIVGYRASNYLGYICKKEDTQWIDQVITEFIIHNHPEMVIVFYDINSNSSLYNVLKIQKSVKSILLYRCPLVDCNLDFETLFKTQISKAKKRTEFRKFEKKLERVGEINLYNIDNPEKWEKHGYLIEDIFLLHAERFAEVFIPEDVCLHKNTEYYTELFENLVKKEKALLSVLTIGGVTVSFLYTVVSDGIVMDWMPAFDPAFSKYNLGTVHLMKFLEYLCGNEKYRILDFSKGAAFYKARWANGETYNYMMVKRYRNDLICRLKVEIIMSPIRLKNALRKIGILDRIKEVLVKVQNRGKDTIMGLSVKGKSIEWTSEFIDGMKTAGFDYALIRAYPIEERKKILDAIYNGIKPMIFISEDHVIVLMSEENK